ncbi:hypothetical protein ACHAW5_004824 [Stephanodiscus triporus]|uniref:Pseudouridine synthase RsuA/RluA-like domain-containing protein n=1 Tax=Stephanodiscus triporus TaxID=2934178 RepID=A0ABD3MU03_9STRA
MKLCLLLSGPSVVFGFQHAHENLLGMQLGRYRHSKNQLRVSEQRVFRRNKILKQPFASSDNRVLLSDKGDAVDYETPVAAINGTAQGLIVTNFYRVPSDGFLDASDGGVDSISLSKLFSIEDITRLRLGAQNVTLPVALMMLDPEKYPTQSRARKAIRQRSICLCRCKDKNDALEFNELGKVIARVYPGDIIGFQRRAGSDYYAVEGVPYRPPPFEVPVVFEDDHMAIVNKPAGIVVYRAEGGRGGGARAGGHGRDTLLSALSFVLMPSNFTIGFDDDDQNVPLKRPHPVHRLDRPTSGLMVVAKTKSAAVHLAQQFEYRKARKTYCAIVNGSPIPQENEESPSKWYTINHDLDGKSAITKWRRLQKVHSLRGKNGQLTLLELKPETGENRRYHQLRRHMAWVCKSPIIGDTTYDDEDESALRFRERGLFLCSNEIELEHPFYNTPSGRKIWRDMDRSVQSHGDAMLREDADTGMVIVKARIELPEKFQSFIERERSRAKKFMEAEE